MLVSGTTRCGKAATSRSTNCTFALLAGPACLPGHAALCGACTEAGGPGVPWQGRLVYGPVPGPYPSPSRNRRDALRPSSAGLCWGPQPQQHRCAHTRHGPVITGPLLSSAARWAAPRGPFSRSCTCAAGYRLGWYMCGQVPCPHIYRSRRDALRPSSTYPLCRVAHMAV